MKRIIFSFFVLAASLNLFAQQDIEKMAAKGLENCYNFKWHEGEEIFQQMIDKYPKDPRGYHYRSVVYLWYYLSSTSKSDFDSFNYYSNTALDKAEKILDENSDNEAILFTTGNIYSCRSIIYGKARNFLDAAWASKKSESYLKDCIELNPNRADAYMGLGLYNFAVSQVPAGFKWVLGIAGIKGDKETGLKYLKKASIDGNLNKAEAMFYLSLIYSDVLGDYNNAAVLLKMLNKKYPDNLLFNYSLGVVEIKRKNLNDAEKYISTVLSENKTQFKQLLSYSNFLMGDIHYKRNDFNGAKNYYLNFLQTTNSNDYKGICSFRLGVCYELTGSRKDAEKYFQLSGKGNMDLDDDIYAKRKGEIFAKRTIAQTEGDLIKAANLIEQGNFKDAVDAFNNLLPEIKSEKLKAEVTFDLAEAYFFLNDYTNSIKYANMAKSLNCSDEKWIKPFSEYYLAKNYRKSGNKELSDKYLDNCDDYSDFDYQNKLKNLIYAFKGGQG